MTENKPRRKHAAILAADLVNFSMMMGEDEDRTLKNLKACRALTDESITANYGRVFGSAGDSKMPNLPALLMRCWLLLNSKKI